MTKPSLSETARLIRSEWLLVFLGILSIMLTAVFILSFISKDETKNQAAWQNIVFPGHTSQDELVQSLGPPKDTEEVSGKTNLIYDSGNQYRPDIVEISNKTVSLIKEQVINPQEQNLDDYIQLYGPPEATIYGKHGLIAPGHFWGNAGILVFSSEFDGTTIEVWYFEPTPLNQFLLQNPELSLKNPEDFSSF